MIALLRAVNLIGSKSIAMADLRGLVEALGHADVQTVVQSGNVIFSTPSRSPAKLEAALEAAMTQHFGRETHVFVRTASEWQAVVAANPFEREAAEDPSHLLVMPLRAAPTPAGLVALRAAIPAGERVEARERQLYVYYPDGIGESKLRAELIERKIGTRSTARNWNTVRKIAAIASERAGRWS